MNESNYRIVPVDKWFVLMKLTPTWFGFGKHKWRKLKEGRASDVYPFFVRDFCLFGGRVVLFHTEYDAKCEMHTQINELKQKLNNRRLKRAQKIARRMT